MGSLKQDRLEGFVYCLFTQMKSVEEAYTSVTVLDPNGQFSLEDVHELYRKFEVEMKVAELAPIALAQKDVIEAVIKHLPLESRLNLRKVNVFLRNETDRAPLYLINMTIGFGPTWYSIIFSRKDGDFKVNVRQVVNRVEVEKTGGRHSVFRTMTRDDYLKSELSTFLFNKRTVINAIGIYPDADEEDFDGECNIMRVLHACRLEAQRQIKVKYVDINLDFNEYVGQSFDIFDPSTLKGVSLGKINPNPAIREEHQGIPIAYDSDQWKNLTEFNCDDTIEFPNQITSLSHFAHLNEATFNLTTSVTPESILMLKELLLKNELLDEFIIHHRLTEADFNRLNGQLGTNNIYEQDERPFIWAIFPYPSNPDAKLAICVMNDQVWIRGPCYRGNWLD